MAAQYDVKVRVGARWRGTVGRMLVVAGLAAVAAVPVGGCKRGAAPKPLVARTQTLAELRAVKRGVSVAPPGEDRRDPYARERLVDGEEVRLEPGGLAWVRRDGGATVLVAGPAAFVLQADTLKLDRGKVFVDTQSAASADLTTPRGVLHLAGVRASIDVADDGLVSAYVLEGGLHTETGASAGPGELLSLAPGGKVTKTSPTVWDDWTGGLATTDPAARPAPFGIGTVGARKPGDKGKPRFALAIDRLDVRVSVNGDFATTEVDEVFFNGSADTVEGLYDFRTPDGAVLQRFGVDRNGDLVWGRVKEKQAAAAQYEAHVYQGSTEDPALLEWQAPGVYRARLYPIKPGETRRVVTRYGEWLGRQGPKGERRLYLYPMAAEGAASTLPRIEEFTATFDLARAHAEEVRVGMHGTQAGTKVVVKSFDLVPRADLALELFDGGAPPLVGFRSAHVVEHDTTPLDMIARAEKDAKGEVDYLLVPIRPAHADEPAGGLDLAIVVDTSAATDTGALAVARAMTSALLAHLGGGDRVAAWAGDATLRPIAEGSDKFSAVDPALRERIATGLAQIDRGGATDLGAIVAEAASKLDAGRRGAVVYLGDGQPTVGELAVADLRARLDRLPRPVRLFTVGIGDRANMGILGGVARGAFATQVTDAYGAAQQALRLLEEAERPVWLGATIDLGPGVDRIYPRDLGALAIGQTALVVGRVVGALPKEVTVRGLGGQMTEKMSVTGSNDGGDARRRWAEGRLGQLLDEAAGRAAVVEVGQRYGVITPFTSLYVPTADEYRTERTRQSESSVAIEDGDDDKPSWLWGLGSLAASRKARYEEAMAENADNKEGGTGTRAKGEEGSMGNPSTRETGRRYGVAGPRDNAPAPPAAEAAAPAEARRKAEAQLAAQVEPTGAMDKATAIRPGAPLGGLAARAPAGAKPSPAAAGGNGAPKRGAADSQLERQAALKDAQEMGMIGLLNTGAGGEPNAPTAPSGRDDSLGQDPMSARGNMWGDQVGDAFGAGGLGLAGIGEGGGGRGEGVGLGNIGTLGHGAGTGTGQGFGSGHGKLGGSHSTKAPQLRAGEMRILPSPDDKLADGATKDLAKTKPQKTTGISLSLQIGAVGHEPRGCAASADLPFDERRALWRERLAESNGSAVQVVRVYHVALAVCEAPGWRERAALLVMLVERIPSITERVALWKMVFDSAQAADIVYRAILTRVHTAAELKDLHDALGLKEIDPAILVKALAAAKTPEERIRTLRPLVEQWKDDLELALRLLDAYEDAGDDGGGRALARRLRRRGDATTRARTAVGEYYLRRASKSQGAAAERDTTEGRRTFGEIVEFAPEDPGARRRLGDLLRAHGWYEEALRQYETLARLVPDDPSVMLLRAAAAQGMGRIEEAIQWTEKGAAGGSPESGGPLAKTARALSSAYLAWARDDATHGGRKDEADRLRERARRLTAIDAPPAGTVRVLFTWSHPELRADLWSNALGEPMPSGDGDPLLGVAEVMLPSGKGDAFVEVRLDHDDAERAARLGAQAMLTAIVDEGADTEHIERLAISFAPVDGKVLERRHLRVDGGVLREEGVR